MDSTFLMLLPFVAVFVLLFPYPRSRVLCPDCGALLPDFCSPFAKTRRMWRAGGRRCLACGCETDLAGANVTADTPPAPFPTRHVLLLGVAVAVAVGLVTYTVLAARPVQPPLADPARAPVAP